MLNFDASSGIAKGRTPRKPKSLKFDFNALFTRFKGMAPKPTNRSPINIIKKRLGNWPKST